MKSWNIRIQPIKKLTKKVDIESFKSKLDLVLKHAKKAFEEAPDFQVKLTNNRHTMEIGYKIKKFADVTLEECDD